MTSKPTLVRKRVAGWTAVGIAALAVGTARADTHFGIISTVSSSPRTAARLNVTAVTTMDAVTFSVFPSDGGATVGDTLSLSPEFFLTSESSADPGIQNLFTGAGGQSALVRAESSEWTAVVLEQYSPEEKIVLSLPPVQVASGTSFQVPIGRLHRATSLLIGNVTGTRNAIIYRYGQGAEQPPVDLPPFGVVVIPVTQENTQLKVRVADASAGVIAQLAVDTGKTTVMTLLPPVSLR